MARSGQGAGEPARAIVAEGSSSPAPRPGASGLDTKMAWGLVGLGLVGHMLRSPRFYETVAVTAIAVGSLRQIGQQNRASMTARLAAWNQREMQRLERKAQRQARAVKGAAQMARSGPPRGLAGIRSPDLTIRGQRRPGASEAFTAGALMASWAVTRWREAAMLKLLYKPVAIVAGIVGGLLSGLIFNRVWKIVGRGSDAPAPLDSERGWGEILLAAGLQGAIYALVKTAVDRGAAEWTRKKTGIWPGGTLQQPDKSPDHRQAKAAAHTAR